MRSVLTGGVLALMIVGGCGKSAPPPQRVSRDHNSVPSPRFAYLTRRVHPPGLQPMRWLSRKQAAQDLDELEWLLVHRSSYAALRGFDCREAIDTLRTGLQDGIDRQHFGLQLRKLVALLGDSHSEVSPPMIAFSTRFLPCLAEPIGERIAAVEMDRSAFLNDRCPFVQGIDGLPVERWLEQAAVAIPKGSPQLVRHAACRMLAYIPYLREELDLPHSDLVELALESADRSEHVTVVRALSDRHAPYRPFPFTDSDVIRNDIGYLRINAMSDDADFLRQIVSCMARFRTTRGLVIDVRGNRGGSRAALRTLLPFFLSPDGPPAVVNIAAYRLGHRPDILESRWLYPLTHAWPPEERTAIEKAMASFAPEVELPEGRFSERHFFVISPSKDPGAYHYDRPVVVLMDGHCHSATDVFLGAFQHRQGITLIGTPSGGGSGASVNLRLRHGGNRTRLSTMVSFRPDGRLYEGHGIHPDIHLDYSPTDLIGKTDTILSRAVQIIEAQVQTVAPD